MADLKITQLDAVVTPDDTDLLETVQDVATIPVNKKITWTLIKSFLSDFFDTLYDALGSASAVQGDLDTHEADIANPHVVTKTQVSLGNVTNDAQLKRASGDINSFTEKIAPVDNDIILIEDSEASFAKKKVLKSALGGGGGSIIPKMKLSTAYENVARFLTYTNGGGTTTYDYNGAIIDTSATISSSTETRFFVANWIPENGSPTVSLSITTWTAGTDYTAAFGIYFGIVDGSQISYINKHFGFKIIRIASGAVNYYATQGDGSVETASASLGTLTAGAGELMDFIMKVNDTTSIDYYTRAGNQALSSATNLTTNIPSNSSATLRVAVSNVGVATRTKFHIGGASYER